MASLQIRKEHTRGRAAARAAVEELGATLAANLGINHRWEGDVLHFEHPDAQGTVTIDDTAVTVDVRLGAMLAFFRGAVEGQIRKYLDEKLT